MDQQLTDARARITQMTDARTQVNDRMQQLQANPPPDGAAILRRQYDQQVQALQQNLEQMQAAIDAAQSSVDALQQQRDRMAGP
jgi:DNA repair exonuclease SbcCD ATPase subunit